MRVCKRYGFVFLCMPKCASTSIEKALAPYSQLSTNDDVDLKHADYRRYSKFIKPFIKKKDIEIVCLMREPISWLHSWYRFRSREAIKDPKHKNHRNYCGNITFQKYIEDYLSDTPSSYANIGFQKGFLVGKNGEIGIDKIFKYENIEKIIEYFEQKIGKSLEMPMLNISPGIDYNLDAELEIRLKEFLKSDYEIYNELN